MASETHPLRPPPPCPTSNGSMGARGGQPAGSPETGDTRLKPPVGPKPRMLPKPAVPAKPCTPPPSPGSRPTRLEFPSAEKINLLAGPKPYSGSSTALKRLSFGLKSPPGETSNGKGAPPPAARAPLCPTEERSLAPVTLPDGGPLGVLKGTAPFKVKPVPVAAKRERFPGTTVEEILAKMERPCKEGSGSPDPAWGPRSIFNPDGSSRFGPKGYAAFRRQPSAEGGEGDAIAPRFEASWVSGPPEAQESRASCGDKPVAGRMKREGSPSPIGERPPEPSDGEAERHPGSASRESGFSPASASCNGDQSGRRKSPFPPGFSSARTCPIPVAPAELPLRVAPGNSAGLALAPGAPYLPAEHPASALGSPAVPAELPALGSPPAHTELPTSVGPGFPGTPESLAKFPIGLVPAPDAPAEPCHRISCSLASLEAPGEGSQPPSGLPAGMAPGTPDAPAELPHSPPAGRALAPGVPAELPRRITHSPGAPKAPVPSPDTPNLCPKLPTRVFWSPVSPDGPTESPVSPYSPPSPERGSPSLSNDAEPFTGPAPADKDFQCPQLGLQHSSDGVVQLPDKGLGMGVLGGSLAALPRGGPPHPGPPLEGKSNWTLSQSFEWAFPSRAVEWEPPRSPIREADDSGLSEQGDSDGEGLAPSPKGSEESSSSEGQRARQLSAALDWQDAEAAGSSARLDGAMGAPCDQGATEVGGLEATCPGGPVAQTEAAVAELKGPAAVDELGTIWEEQGRPLLGAPLRLTEPEPDQEQAAPVLLSDAPRPVGADRCQEDDLASVGSCQEGLRPGKAGSEPHPNARWLDELLASPPPSADETKRKGMPEPRDPAGPEDLLGWSRKDLCSEFGIRGAHRAGEFGWASETGTGKTEWPGSYRAGETEQDREFGTGTRDWSGVYKETELLGDSNMGHGNWPDAYGIGDSCRQEGEFSPGKPDWSSQYNTGGAVSSDGEFSTRKLDWTSTYGIGDNTQQDERFSTSKPDWTPEYSVGDTARQDREFGNSRPDSTHEPGVGDIDQQDREFGILKPDWTREHGVGDTAQQAREYGTSKPDWTHEHGVGDTDQQDRELGTSKPDWTHEHDVGDTDQQDREFGTSKLDWTHECSVKTSGQGREWTREYDVGNTAPEDKSDWTRKFGDDAQQDRVFSPDKPAWLGEYGIHHTDQESAFGSGVGDPDSSAQEPGARKPGWSGTDWQESKFLFARRDCVSDFRIRGAEHESQYGVIGTERAGGFGLSALDPSGAFGTLGPAELGESRTDWAGHTRTVDLDEPRETGVGHSDWAQDLGLHGTGPSVGLGAISPEEPSRGWMDWTNELSVSSMDPSSSLGVEGFDTPREPGVGQPDGASDLGTGGPATARGFKSVGPAEASARQTDWSHEFGSGDKGSAETGEAGAGQMDWASEDRTGRGKQTNATAMTGLELHGDSSGPGSPQLSSPSPLLEEMLAKAVTQRKSPREERGLPPGPDAHPPPLPQEEDGGPWPEGDGAPSPSDATDRGWLPIEARRLSQPGHCGSQPSPPREDFAFLEDMEVLDSTIYRSRANLGRKRGHRAPAMRTAGTLALSEVEVADWMFRDSTEPRATRWVSSDEEAAEEPQSRRTRPSLAAKGLKVPLFPGLNPSALKAKLRGRNRSAEEGAQLGEAKPTPPKEPHVQRSKSCKIPGLGGKPLVLPPKPEKSSGSAMAAASSPPRSDATSPHWLQALKLKKKKS
ncbi:182 kDa tankyrase-1-binding protein isoform X6 [Chelonia mydas]|uniref:182 kDa tankyrase-1-binding protein isoform X6 n=1 Tax=Chelonia mydas TaxID=8469 RepID=UPI001CAA01A7|nr:182 kDa tankyrase-1-binding protein isoform X6 [Chelonia mydas]